MQFKKIQKSKISVLRKIRSFPSHSKQEILKIGNFLPLHMKNKKFSMPKKQEVFKEIRKF